MLFIDILLVLVVLLVLSVMVSWLNSILNPAFMWSAAFVILMGGIVFVFPTFFATGLGLQPDAKLAFSHFASMTSALFLGKLALFWLVAGCVVGFLYFVSEVRHIREQYDDLSELHKNKYEGEHSELKLKAFVVSLIYHSSNIAVNVQQVTSLQQDIVNIQQDIDNIQDNRSLRSNRLATLNKSLNDLIKDLNDEVAMRLPPSWSVLKSTVITASLAWPVTAMYLICHRLFIQLFRFIADYVTGAMNVVSKWAFGKI